MVRNEVIKSLRYIIDEQGRRTAVLLDIREWELLLNWIETVTDRKIAVEALEELQKSGGRPQQAGWLAWDDISEEWGEKKKTKASKSQL